MLSCSSINIAGKDVKILKIDNRLVYSTVEDAKVTVNNYAWSVLSNSLSVGSGHYNQAGTSIRYDYNIYSTFDEGEYTGSGAGNSRPFVVSQHILATASHYPSKPTGAITIGGQNIIRNEWVNLKEWALQNGHTEEEFAEMKDIDDISLCKCDKSTSIPDNCIPWFMSKERMKDIFYRQNIYGVIGWRTPQTYDGIVGHTYAVPVMFKDTCSWTTLNTSGISAEHLFPQEWIDKFNSMGNLYFATTGDSGKIAYMMYEGKPVIISACKTVGAGADYTFAHHILKEFVEAYGDTLKEI